MRDQNVVLDDKMAVGTREDGRNSVLGLLFSCMTASTRLESAALDRCPESSTGSEQTSLTSKLHTVLAFEFFELFSEVLWRLNPSGHPDFHAFLELLTRFIRLGLDSDYEAPQLSKILA